MSWYYNSTSGAVNSDPLPNLPGESYIQGLLNWHGPFPTKQAALDYYTQNKAAHPGWKAPAGLGQNITNATTAVVGTGVSAVTGWLGQSNLWRRVLEVAAGLLLLGLGANYVLKPITSTAAKYAKRGIV